MPRGSTNRILSVLLGPRIILCFVSIWPVCEGFATFPFVSASNHVTQSHPSLSLSDGYSRVHSRLCVIPNLETTTASSILSMTTTNLILSTDASIHGFANVDPADTLGLPPSTATFVFIVGLMPFLIAAIEFWRRIALKKSFGTGSDAIVFTTVIGEDNSPNSSRGQRVLGKDALVLSYILFAVASVVVAIVIASIVTSAPPPPS